MDIWAQMWPNPHPSGKIHRSVVKGLMRLIGLTTSFEAIYRMVDMSGIEDETDKLATSRALRDIRNAWRNSYDPTRKAITR